MEPGQRQQSRATGVMLAAGAALGLLVAAVLWSWAASADVMSSSEFRTWAMWSVGFLLVALAATLTVGRDRRGLLGFVGVLLGYAAWVLWQLWVALSSSA